MKILEVIPNLACGGAENFIVALCNEFYRNGHDVTLLTFYPRSANEFLYDKLEDGVSTDCIGKRPGIDAGLSYKLWKYIKTNKFQIAHFHVQAVSYAAYCAMMNVCGCVATIHNDAYKEACGIHRMIRKFLFRYTRMAAITISGESERTFKELYKSPSVLIYNGIAEYESSNINKDVSKEVASYRISPNTKVVVNVASVTPQKNQVRIAEAINRLAADGEDIVGVFLGRITNAAYGEMLKNQCSDYVKYIGEVRNPRDYMAECDFFALTSEYEGMPISLLEAFSTTTIPIVSAVGGCKNLVTDGVNGFVTIGTSVGDIANAIRRACHADAPTVAQMKRCLMKDFEEYTIAKCAKKHLDLFRSLVATGHH